MQHLKDLRTRIAVRELQLYPEIGSRMAANLVLLGVTGTTDLAQRDPEELFARYLAQYGPQDRCVLYVLRCAVYLASNTEAGTPPDPQRAQWWQWADADDPRAVDAHCP